MHKECPLPEQLWLDWITEVEAATQVDDDGNDAAIVPALTPLLEKAVNDYLSIPLWIKYIEIAAIRDAGLSLSPSHCCPNHYQQQRAVCERAVAVAGLHWTEGWKVWDAYRIFETSILETLDEAINDGTNNTQQVTQWKEEQEGVARQLYHRQLSLPHDNLAATLQSYCEWEMERNDQWNLPHEVKSLYEKTLKHTELRRPYEDSITQATGLDERLLAAYLSYIKVEESNLINATSSDKAGVSRVCVLYERAVAVFPVTHHLWLSYARFLEHTSDDKGAVVNVYWRAVRNCPWVGQLWSRLMRAEERAGGDGSSLASSLSSSLLFQVPVEVEVYHQKMYDKALTSSIQGISIYGEGSEGCIDVVIACLEFIRRRGGMWGGLPVEGALRQCACEAAQLLSQHCPEACDSNGRIASMLTAIENMEKSQDKAKSGASPAALEAREELLKTAVAKQGATWLAFINQDKRNAAGAAAISGDETSSSLAAVRALFERAVNRLRSGGGYGLKQVCRSWLQFEQEYGSSNDHFTACLKVDPILVEIAAAEAAAQASAQMTASAHAAVAAAANAPPARSARPASGDRDNARGGRSSGRGAAAGGRGGGRDKDNKDRGKKRQTTTGSDGGEKSGDAPPPSKRSKPDDDDVHDKKDRDKKEKKPALLPKQQQQQQKDNKARPKQKDDASTVSPEQQSKSAAPDTTATAFVKHLWEEATQDNLKDLFEPYGTIAVIKLNRNPITGKHKGFAYVKYETEDAMKAACEGLGGKEVHGKHLFVAPSNPPADRGGRGGGGGDGGRGGGRGGGGGLGGRGAGPSDRAHVKLDVGDGVKSTSFLPRAVATRPTDYKINNRGAPKSNEEFRKMLFAKKE